MSPSTQQQQQQHKQQHQHPTSPRAALAADARGTWVLAASAAAHAGSSGGSSADGADASTRVAAAVAALVSAPLPPRNLNITPDAPLLYIHQRKAAGSSLRRALVEAAKLARLPFFAACKAGVRCETFGLQGAPEAALYAGHFSWAEMRQLSRQAVWDAGRGAWRRNPRLHAGCLTNFREPLARLESCFYFKRAVAAKQAEKAGRPPLADACLSDLPASEMRSVLSAGGEHSCLNEPLRMLSGLADSADSDDLARLPTRTAVLELAMAHLAHCVPVVLELPGSLRLGAHWFPQLSPAFQNMQQRNVGTSTRCPLSHTARQTLAELAAEERVVYDAAVARAHAMLAALPPEDAQAAAEARGWTAAAEAGGAAAARAGGA